MVQVVQVRGNGTLGGKSSAEDPPRSLLRANCSAAGYERPQETPAENFWLCLPCGLAFRIGDISPSQNLGNMSPPYPTTQTRPFFSSNPPTIQRSRICRLWVPTTSGQQPATVRCSRKRTAKQARSSPSKDHQGSVTSGAGLMLLGLLLVDFGNAECRTLVWFFLLVFLARDKAVNSLSSPNSHVTKQ